MTSRSDGPENTQHQRPNVSPTEVDNIAIEFDLPLYNFRFRRVAEELAVERIRRQDGAIGLSEALTENCELKTQIEAQQARIEQLERDSLTGVYTRTVGEEKLLELIKEVEGNRRLGVVEQDTPNSFALAIFDGEGMKRINDEFGHQAGDKRIRLIALTAIARFLAENWRTHERRQEPRPDQTKRHGDTIYRLGGDEFVIIVPYNTNHVPKEVIEETIAHRLSQPFGDITVKFGIAHYEPGITDTIEKLKKSAEPKGYSVNRHQLVLFDDSPFAADL
jgi:GGDEF domain-containing protein